MPLAITHSPGRHALLGVAAAHAFATLDVSATIWDGEQWRPLHHRPSVIMFEVEHGVELARNRYNTRCMDRAWRRRELVLGEHAGFCDLFAPLVASDGAVLGVLVVGPYATKAPTSAAILERWHSLTGRQGHPVDPEFAEYVSTTLSTLVLERGEVRALQRVVELFATLVATTGDAESLRAELDPLLARLARSRHVERVWAAASSMLDRRTHRSWSTPFRDLASLDLSRVPDRVLVGLVASRARDPEPVDELVRLDAFQRACVKLAASNKGIAGRVGDHGVALLALTSGSEARRREHLLELSNKATLLARRFGFRVHFGLSGLGVRTPLWQRYPAALAAAESGLFRGVGLSEGAQEAKGALLGELRRHLLEVAQRKPAILPAEFDRYLETVGLHCGFQLAAVRAHVEAGFEPLIEALSRLGSSDTASLAETQDSLAHPASEPRTVTELFALYRRGLRDIVAALEHPVSARRDRSLRRAITYIHQHHGEPLTMPGVARIAGFAPNYFSTLFRQREGVTFERYVQNLRVERAKHLLATTDLSVERVAELSGFAGRPHFAHVFKRLVGVTPSQHRQAALLARPR